MFPTSELIVSTRALGAHEAEWNPNCSFPEEQGPALVRKPRRFSG